MDKQRAVFVGIDVSKDRLDVHLRPSGEAFSVLRDDRGLADLVSGRRPKVRFRMETGPQ
jgi:transposase